MTAQPPDHTEPSSGTPHPGYVRLIVSDLFVLTVTPGAAVVLVVTHSTSRAGLAAVAGFVVSILTAWRHRRGR